MKKSILTVSLLTLGCVMASLYGMLHNQISYTVSHEYFDRFKFIQFHIAPGLQGRVGASLVGLAASWWMGIVIGVCLLFTTKVFPIGEGYSRVMIKAYCIAAGTALVTGLLALLYAFATLDVTTVGEVVRYGQEIHDPVAFMRAGTMHNFSYLGGFLGIVTGSVSLILERGRGNPNVLAKESTRSQAPLGNAVPGAPLRRHPQSIRPITRDCCGPLRYHRGLLPVAAVEVMTRKPLPRPPSFEVPHERSL